MPLVPTSQQSIPNPGLEAIRLNVVLLCLALGVESIFRPDPETFLQEQMRLWHQGSDMWLHTLLESEKTVESYEAPPGFQDAPLLLVPEQTRHGQVVPAEVLPTSQQETE